MSVKARYNVMTKAHKDKRREQQFFNQGIPRSSSIISGTKKITRIDSGHERQTDYGMVSDVYKGDRFEVSTEYLGPSVNSGNKVATTSTVFIVLEGAVTVSRDGQYENLSAGSAVVIDAGTEYFIATKSNDWAQLIRIQGSEPQAVSKPIIKDLRTADGTVLASVVRANPPVAAVNVEAEMAKRSKIERSRMLAAQAESDKNRALRGKRSGRFMEQRVSLSGTPIYTPEEQ